MTSFDPDLGLRQDRRTLLKFLAGGAVLAVAGCASDSTSSNPTAVASGASTAGTTAASTAASATTGTSATTAGSTSATADVARIPQETAGPYPGDGSNGPDVLAESGVVRRDVRASFGASTTAVDGVPLDVELTIVDVASGGPKAGAAVYIWHCDAEGRYSMYSPGVTNENFLRGVQEAGADGKVTFTTVYPGCYQGRWPHIHFEVYESLEAINAGSPIATSQLAMPDTPNKEVFADGRYPASARNYQGMSLQNDMVFADDGGVHETPLTTGDVMAGYSAVLNVGV